MRDAAVRTRILVHGLLQHQIMLQQPEQTVGELERREKRKRRPDDQAPQAALYALHRVAVGLEAVRVAPVRNSNFGRPTPSTRRRPRNCGGSMAWRFIT